MMIKKILLFVAFTTLLVDAEAQVPKKIFVEHFTNTLCGPCGQRNPGFYGNLENQTEAVHISIHSSAPYSNCVLYQQNIAPSDARRFYYTINSTPSLIINGFAIPTQNNYASPSLFSPFQGQTSPVSIRMEQQKFGMDSMQLRVIVKTEANHSLGTQQFFVGLAEDTVFYNAPNGEGQHYDVFRSQLQLSNLTIPTTIGDSLVFNYTIYSNVNWDFNRIFAFAMVQNVSNQSVNQSESTAPSTNNLGTSVALIPSKKLEGVRVFPNPTNGILNISLENNFHTSRWSLYNAVGQVLIDEVMDTQATLDLRGFSKGIYFIRVENVDGFAVKKVLLE